jgi:hypothetical protein
MVPPLYETYGLICLRTDGAAGRQTNLTPTIYEYKLHTGHCVSLTALKNITL